MDKSRLLGAAFVGFMGFSIASYAASIAFEFNEDGVLPSAQGATYLTGPGAGVSEESVFSTSGGILTQDMSGLGASYAAYGVE